MKWEKVLYYIRAAVGLPLMYLGVVLLLLHFLLHTASNGLLIAAIVLELIGVVAHYYKVRRNR